MIVTWLMSILAVVVLYVIADLVLGEGRMGKFVNAVFASLTILIIVAPIPNMIRNGIDADNVLFVPETAVDENFLEGADKIKASALARGVEKAREEEGYAGVEVTIEGKFEDEIIIGQVQINLRNLVMDEKVVHINKYDAITRLVSKYLSVDRGVIMIYE